MVAAVRNGHLDLTGQSFPAAAQPAPIPPAPPELDPQTQDAYVFAVKECLHMYHRTHTGDFKFALSGNADLPPNEDAVVPQTEDAQSLRQAAHNFANVIMDKVDDKAQAAVMAERALSEFVVEAILHRSAPRGGKIAPAFDMDNI